MKILYAIQGTGNGHLTRATEIIPELLKRADVDILMSGAQVEVKAAFNIKYRYHGLGFVFGKKGGIDYWSTFTRMRSVRFMREIRNCPVSDYDLVLNDFEPVSAWACRLRGVPCVGMSHQAAVLNDLAPQAPNVDRFGKSVLRNYAPCDKSYGFHFETYANRIFTPIIRKEVRQAEIANKGHYTVYLPSFSDRHIHAALRKFPHVKWEVFSKRARRPKLKDNVYFHPIDDTKFIQSLATSTGVVCGAGFETPAEALFMGKKLLVIPMKHQYEQECNAFALEQLGAGVVHDLKPESLIKIGDWVRNGSPIAMDYPDETSTIVDTIVQEHAYELHEVALSSALI